MEINQWFRGVRGRICLARVRTSKDDTRSGLEASIHDDGDEGSTDRALSPGAKWKGEEKKRRRWLADGGALKKAGDNSIGRS
jgi:hypothetical protein